MKYSDRHISDEELDQLFRDAHASEGQEALFVPEFWSEMEAMMPAEPKKKRGLYWIPLSAALILIGTLLFYPPNPAQIEHLAKNQHTRSDQSSLITDKERPITNNASLITDKERLNDKEKSAVTAENSTVQSTGFVSNKQQIKQRFKTRVQNSDNRQNKQVVERTPQNQDETNNENTAENNSVDPHSPSEDDEVILAPRYENVPHEEIVPLPVSKSRESSEWYAELGPSLGQSPYLSPNQKRNAVSGAVFGGGYTKRIDNAFVSFGLQGRLEGFGGLEYRETNFTPNIVRTVSVKQLYSLEIPLKFGYTFKRSEFAVAVVPGIQLFIHGKERITENQVVKREDSFTGKVEHSNSLTMEFGLQYYYNFNSKWGVGAKMNADILRPFHTDYYLGKSTGLPLNGQIVLRRRFSK